MKHLLLFFALFFFFSASGQDTKITSSTKDHKKTITWVGFKGGFNRSRIVGRELDGDKTGYIGGELYGGFFAETVLSKRVNVETELLFSWTEDYHFIELPVHLELTFGRKWSIFMGPKLDYVVDNAFETGYRFKKFGISADMGVQYNITRIFFAEIRHSRGFTEQVTDTFLEIYDGKRNTSRIGLGICF